MHGPHRITEQFQVFLEDLCESFWGVIQGKVRDTLKRLLEADSEQRMEQYLELKWYERAEERADSRHGFYERDYVTPWGVIRFLPPGPLEGQTIYQAPSLAQARRAFQRFQWNWQRVYPGW